MAGHLRHRALLDLGMMTPEAAAEVRLGGCYHLDLYRDLNLDAYCCTECHRIVVTAQTIERLARAGVKGGKPWRESAGRSR